jgi:hypothetical protein
VAKAKSARDAAVSSLNLNRNDSMRRFNVLQRSPFHAGVIDPAVKPETAAHGPGEMRCAFPRPVYFYLRSRRSRVFSVKGSFSNSSKMRTAALCLIAGGITFFEMEFGLLDWVWRQFSSKGRRGRFTVSSNLKT